MSATSYCSFNKILEDPRAKSSRYSKGSRVKFDKDQYDFAFTQFIIDKDYVGDPPHVQISIDNLNDNIDENFLKKDLAKMGRIRSLEIIRHPRTGQHLGLAKVQFEDVSVAKACIENFNGKHIMGRQLKVFLDVRFAVIEKLKEDKLNPRPQPPPTNRPRLEDRIATLMRQPNCVLSTMVGPQANHGRASGVDQILYSQPWSDLGPTTVEPEEKILRLTMIGPQESTKLCTNHGRTPSQSWSDLGEDSPEPINIELNEEQIDNEVLPHCFEEFFKELTKNLETTIFKKLRESYGYQCLEKAQAAYKQKQDQIQLQRDQERIQHELQKQFETRFILSKSRSSANDRHNEAPRPRVNLVRQRCGDFNDLQDTRRRGEADLRRVNRSSAYVSEPGRRGSHSTSIESEFSDGGSSARSSRSPSASSSSSASSVSSRSSSPFGSSSSESCSSYSRSSSRSGSFSPRSDDSDRESVNKDRRSKKSGIKVVIDSKSQSATRGKTNVIDYSQSAENARLDDRTEDEDLAVSALLDMGVNKAPCSDQTPDMGDKLIRSGMDDFLVDDEDDKKKTNKKGAKSATKKRKKAEVLGVASEYRAAKRFAADPRGTMQLDEENLENAMMVDENLIDMKPESRVIFPERSADEKKRMLNDLYGTLTEEDLKYLREIHTSILGEKVPFGSDSANKAHLNLSKRMIESKTAEGHPKWWRGCSRCDVIEVSEKEKMQIETNYEDLTKAPIKSNVIQVATSSRRDLRGDQRRIAVLNPELDADILKFLTTNTLQVSFICVIFHKELSICRIYKLTLSLYHTPKYRCVPRISDFLGVRSTNGVYLLARRLLVVTLL